MRSTGLFEDFWNDFGLVRIRKPSDVPMPDKRIIDVALLDMHHSWPNLGHDSLVRAVGEIAMDLGPLLKMSRISIRVLSFDIRERQILPEAPGERFLLYIGTGGPGNIDPRMNDGVCEGAQGIREDPTWESPLFQLFDAIKENPEASLLPVCHTFGVLCRWSGIARPQLRGPEKGGKSSGIVENVLTPDAIVHPWFSCFAARLPDGRHFKVLDNRLYDLIPGTSHFPAGVVPIAFEPRLPGAVEGEALTVVEFARDLAGVMPRMLAANHHPEVRNRKRQQRILSEKLARGEVTAEWHDERARTLEALFLDRKMEQSVALTSQYTLIAPLRFHLYRLVRCRAAALGCRSDLHENRVLRHPSGTLEREVGTDS